jgi:ribonuclease-3
MSSEQHRYQSRQPQSRPRQTGNSQNNSTAQNLIVDPWNSNNRLLTKDDVYTIYERAGFVDARKHIQINDLSKYQTAFIHSSYVRKSFDTTMTITPRPDDVLDLFPEMTDYENQEFLGDRVLDFAVAFYIYRKYPNTTQGFKTILKTKIVKTNNLASFAEYLGLSKHLIVSRQVEENQVSHGRHNPRILEDTMEAFICAIFLDQNQTPYYSKSIHDIGSELRLIGPGWAIANAFIEHCIERLIDFESFIRNEDNYKQVLLIYYQKEFHTTPKYIQINVEGPPNNRIYTLGVLDKEGNIICRAQGKSKQEAEQTVSKMALDYYGASKSSLLE